MLTYLLQGLALGGVAAAQPGPFQAFLLSLVARAGWRRALPASLAPLISDGPIVILVLIVLTRLPAWSLGGLRLAGGLFLLWLAWGAWQTFRQPYISAEDKAPPGSAMAALLKASVMNLLSPSPYIYWATVAGPILIAGWREDPALGLAFLLGFYVALIGGLALFIVLAGMVGRISPRVNQGMAAFSAVALLAFALFQMGSGLRALVAA